MANRNGRPRVTLDGALWIAQCIVAFVFFWVGSLRALVPIHDLELESGWLDSVAAQTPIRVVGVVEVTLALLVLVPSMTRFWPRLAPIASLGLAVFSAFGFVEHVVHGEPARAVGAAILVVLSLFVTWGRFGPGKIRYMPWDSEDRSDWPALSHRPLDADPETGHFDPELEHA